MNNRIIWFRIATATIPKNTWSERSNTFQSINCRSKHTENCRFLCLAIGSRNICSTMHPKKAHYSLKSHKLEMHGRYLRIRFMFGWFRCCAEVTMHVAFQTFSERFDKAHTHTQDLYNDMDSLSLLSCDRGSAFDLNGIFVGFVSLPHWWCTYFKHIKPDDSQRICYKCCWLWILYVACQDWVAHGMCDKWCAFVCVYCVWDSFN